MNIQINISLCRVCMKSEIGKSMLEDELLHNKFEFVTNLRVQNGDNLPALICEKCILLLNLSHKFVKTAHETEKNLKKFLAKINNDFKLVTKSAAEAAEKANSDEVEEMLELICGNEETPKENLKTTSRRSPSKERTEDSLKTSNEAPIRNEENNFVTMLGELVDDDDDTNVKVETCFLKTDECDSKNEQHLSKKYEIESMVDFQSVTDITKADNELMDLDAILVTDEDTVQLNEDPINGQPLKHVSYAEEYEALLEDDSASMDIILYEAVDESATLETAADVDDVSDDKAKNAIEEATFVVQLQSETENDITKTAAESEAILPINESETETTSSMKSPSKASTSKKSIINSKIESKRFYCTQCKRDFSSKTNLTRHLALHDGKRPFQCEICLKGFGQNGTLKQHMYIHTGEKPHVCTVCKRGFTQSKSLVFHMRRHSGEKPHQCDYCSALFRQKDALKVHIFKHHMDTNERVFSCKICNKEMGVQALRNHMKSHLNNHKTNDNTNDIMQLISETNLLSESSVLMNDEFSLKVDGSTHVIDIMATSTTEPRRAKKYQCRKCFKCFAIKKSLIRHLSFHDAESTELHQCELCSLTFDHSVTLKAHFTAFHEHTAVPAIECDKCHLKFSNSDDLDKHTKTAHIFINFMNKL